MDYRALSRRRTIDSEDLRKFGIIHSNTFCTLYPVDGCFECNGQFIVYSIDDCGHIHNVKRYPNPILAYSDLANELGFEFNTSKDYLQEIITANEAALSAPINFEGTFELDCKEYFRKQAIQHEPACYHCIIDSSTFSEISSIDGCFEYRGQFIVYSVDERSNTPSNIMRYTNSFKAYSDLAKRMGFELKLPEIDPQKDFLKEQFKKKLKEYEEASATSINCDIDTLGFSNQPSTHGCFYDVNSWYVYSIDEENNIFNVEKHANCSEAYSDLAKRIGFVFEVE